MTLSARQAPYLLRSIGAATKDVMSRSGRIASIGLLVVLVTLPGFALWGATATYQTGVSVRRATGLSNTFEQARYAVGAEESLERKYRLEPSEKVRGLHLEAGVEMVTALKQAAAVGDPADTQIIDGVLARHEQYLKAISRMFAAVDAQDVEAANAIDEAEVDPSFNEIETEVVKLSDFHRIDAADHLKALSAIQGKVLVATPVVFLLGVLVVMFFWRVMRAYQRRVEDGLLREASTVRASEQRFRGLVQNTSDMILICTASGTITYRSPAAETSWDFPATDLLGQPIMAFAHPDDQPALRDILEQLQHVQSEGVEGQTRTTELRLRDGNNTWREAELIGTNLLHDSAVQGMVLTIRDIRERKAFEQQLTQQAFYDGLTGLPNRVLFHDRLQQSLVRAGRWKTRVGLLFLDLDNFKLVNDSLGHQTGDEMLIEAAARLRNCVRAQDTVARLGGDEFVVILDLLADEEDTIIVAKAIQHQFSRPFMLDGREIIVTVSVGIAVSEPGQDGAETLLRNADVAMYRAKSDGRARYIIFDPSMHTDSLARLELENDLRHALDNGELRVYYQPIVMMASGVFTEVEALVRWQHPTRGLVSPVEFIPIAEDTGLIIPLGLWVLETACRQVAAWHREIPSDPPLILSVNLSPRQFQQPSLVEDVALALKDSGLPPGSLKLEITEGVIMRNAEATIETLWKLKDLGIQLAIDDFGTGYSSLSYLKRLPVDVLKIDQSFVQGIGKNPEDNAIVHATLMLAKSLKLKVTGEGIETCEQAALLSEWGCDNGQGYLFGKAQDHEKAGLVLGAAAKRRSDARAGADDAEHEAGMHLDRAVSSG